MCTRIKTFINTHIDFHNKSLNAQKLNIVAAVVGILFLIIGALAKKSSVLFSSAIGHVFSVTGSGILIGIVLKYIYIHREHWMIKKITSFISDKCK